MEGNSLFNPGFLGGNFSWWVGQIADDSTWRENIVPTVYNDKYSVAGWGYRYKVRILGIHDWGEESIPSSSLPWAQVMYPITAGGGQTDAFATPAIRQGNMVFGFFMDQQDQQIPVIMGILGSNAQQELSSTTGDNRVTNKQPGTLGTSGYAEGQNPTTGNQKPQVPDTGRDTKKPNRASQRKRSFCAPPAPNVKLDKYGRDPTKTVPREVLLAVQEAREEARSQGITGEALEDIVGRTTMEASRNYCKSLNSPNSPSEGRPEIESTDFTHGLTVADVKETRVKKVKHVLMSPCDPPTSAMSAIQTTIDNLINYIDGWLSTITSYIDAAAAVINSLEEMEMKLDMLACEIAKYLKIIMDKIMEYALKMLNKSLVTAVAAIPSTMRNMFGDVKQIITELLVCLYNKITDSMCDMIADLLKKAFPLKELEEMAQEAARNDEDGDNRTAPYVPVCYAEDLVGKVIAAHKVEIEEANQNVLDNISVFVLDIQEELAGLTDAFAEITEPFGDISGGITAALSFDNLKLNILGCELKPNCPISDYYTIQDGGSSQADTETPSNAVISATSNFAEDGSGAGTIRDPFAIPDSFQGDVQINPSSSEIA